MKTADELADELRAEVRRRELELEALRGALAALEGTKKARPREPPAGPVAKRNGRPRSGAEDQGRRW